MSLVLVSPSMRAVKIVRYLVGLLITLIGLASFRGDLTTWWGWLEPFRKNPWPWILLVLGLALLFGPAIWPLARHWIAERSGVAGNQSIPFDAPPNADLEV